MSKKEVAPEIKKHFSQMGKKSWQKRQEAIIADAKKKEKKHESK
jgi:hypothetical protein